MGYFTSAQKAAANKYGVLLGRLHGVPTPVTERVQREVHRQAAGRTR